MDNQNKLQGLLIFQPEMSKWELQDHMVVEMVQTALALDSNERGMNETSSNTYKGR